MCHLLGDMKTIRTLMRHWSAAYSGRKLDTLPVAYGSIRAIEALASEQLPPRFIPDVRVQDGPGHPRNACLRVLRILAAPAHDDRTF
jgi:hypothetical protein